MSASTARPHVTRLAPSPTGALHLGNARTFLINWALARQRGWQIVLRIDDLDGPRIKTGTDLQAIEILQWLGMDWDAGPFYQSHTLDAYRAALTRLAGEGIAYPCRCTRSQIQAASLSAPQEGDHELRYPGSCRPPQPARFDPNSWGDEAVAWRVQVPDGMTLFVDRFAGSQAWNVQNDSGDFLIATKQGVASYQLAVVIDDSTQQVSQVVRGDDLLSSTPRQMLLYDRLQLAPLPEYWHLPLVVGTDGRRLAKRHGDTRLTAYRDAGVSPERVLGLLAEWSGLGPRRELASAEFLARFDIDRVPRRRIVFTQDDDAWLRR
jgi:glutamyl-tRNA synthetase